VPLLAFDVAKLGRLHPATAWATELLLIRHPLQAAIAYADTWQRIAAWLTPPIPSRSNDPHRAPRP
jgi:hypothetical protein